MTDLLTPPKYRGCKFSTQKYTPDPRHLYCEYLPPPSPPGERLHSRSRLWTEKNRDLYRAPFGQPDEPAEFSSKISLEQLRLRQTKILTDPKRWDKERFPIRSRGIRKCPCTRLPPMLIDEHGNEFLLSVLGRCMLP